MRGWPPITEPELLARMALDQEQFLELVMALAPKLGARECTDELVARAFAYPWERPGRSYVLRDGAVTLLDDLPLDEREAAIAAFTADRHPLVAIGSNAAPSTLTAKFAHFPDAVDREVLVVTGALHDMDVGAAASLTAYGAMPATLLHSPGTAVRAAVLWLTAAQATLLTWSEFSYHLARLEQARFVADDDGPDAGGLFAFVSRFGALCLAGEPVALAAVPATGRVAAALTQEQILDAVAALLLDPGAGAERLVRATYEDLPGVVAAVGTALWPHARQLPHAAWTPFPAARPAA